MCGFCNVWVCVCVGFVMCGCFDNCVGVLVISVLVLTLFCIVCTVFLYCFFYVYSYSTLRGPCSIVIYSYNEGQRYALFLSFI